METMDVSVVIPTFNRPEFLQETLESVLAQSRPAREIIVVDNGTGPETARLLERYGNRVVQIKIDPVGQQAARNSGIAAATSTWVAFLDDDDLYRPTFQESVGHAIEDGRANMIVTDHRKFAHPMVRTDIGKKTNAEMAPEGYWDGVSRPENGQEWSYIGSFPPERLLRFNAFYPSTMVLRKDLLELFGGFDPSVRGINTEDLEFTCRALPAARLAFVWKDLVDYRVHPFNTSGDWIAQRFGRWRIFEFVREKNAHGSAALHEALEANLPERRRSVFDVAFLYLRFDVVVEAAARLSPKDWTLKRRLMMRIATLPRPLTRPLVSVEDRLLRMIRVSRTRIAAWREAP